MTTCVSLRSFYDSVDVSEIAKEFGGGGHKKAAGFGLLQGVQIEDIFDSPYETVPDDAGVIPHLIRGEENV
jgi:nanoRNase/pAp phosphatase (c-di-AMP/oligoRNAs hydrolase)